MRETRRREGEGGRKEKRKGDKRRGKERKGEEREQRREEYWMVKKTERREE